MCFTSLGFKVSPKAKLGSNRFFLCGHECEKFKLEWLQANEEECDNEQLAYLVL